MGTSTLLAPTTSLALALILAACSSANPAAPSDPLRAPLGDSPQRGPADAWVTLVEFADFACPFSAEEEPILEQLLADLPLDVRLVYKQFPLYPLHPDSRAAAAAAECAREQGPAPDGLFWPMHDLLFANQSDLSAAALQSYASQIAGLDLNAWSACAATEAPLDAALADETAGRSFGVSQTPTLAINGAPLVGAYTYASLRARVDGALAVAQASGIPRAAYYQQAVLGQ